MKRGGKDRRRRFSFDILNSMFDIPRFSLRGHFTRLRALSSDKDSAAAANGAWGRLWRLAGIDGAIGYSIAATAVRILATPVTLVCVARWLSRAEQGYYYTFTNILGITALFGAGLPSVLLVFASHERAALRWTERGTLEGAPEPKSRLASLLRFGECWFGVAALLVLVFLLPGGYAFFLRHDSGAAVHWRAPWAAAVAVTAAGALLGPVNAILEGCGRVREIRFLNFLKPSACFPLLWLTLWSGGGLYAGAVFLAGAILVNVAWLARTHGAFTADLWNAYDRSRRLRWRDLWPLQWRTALSWVSGYLVLQLYNPVLFAFHGPESAGQMGMSLSLAQALNGAALLWVDTKTPRMGALWASKRYRELDRLFLASLVRSMAAVTAAALALLGAVVALQHISPGYGGRLLPPLPFALLLAGLPFGNLFVAQSAYLRANKRDPLVWLSLLSGAGVAAGNVAFGRPYGALGMVASSLGVHAAGGLAATLVLLWCRRRWQRET